MPPSIIFLVLTFCCCSLQLDFTAAQKDNESCLTPTREAGTCIHLDKCAVLYDILKKPNLTQDDRNFLNLSQCGYANNTVSVCCPTKDVDERAGRFTGTRRRTATSEETKNENSEKECLTPRNATGTCINLDQCQVLYNLLTKLLTPEETELLRSSQCGYVNQIVQVCCPTKPELKRNVTSSPTPLPGLTDISKETANNTSCVTPNKEKATCIELDKCQYLFNLLLNVTEDDKDFLRRSQCGYENKKVLICCPDHQRVVLTSLPTSSTTQSPPISTLPSPPHCGLVLTNRIYGGSIAGPDEFPWLALVEYTKSGNGKGFHCGGALLSDRYVLTAAHCTKGRALPADWTLTGVRLGEYDITTDPDCETDENGKPNCNPGYVDVSVEEIIAHREYDPDSRNKQHDIALLRMAKVVAITSFIKPICLPSAANLRSEAFTGTAMDVAGWGRTERLKSSNLKLKATVNVWSLEDCRIPYSSANISLERTHMCAGGVEGVDSCSGDSGGPLMVQMNAEKFNVFFVAGIVSFGPTPCGRPGWPGVYTRVGSYITWIQENVRP